MEVIDPNDISLYQTNNYSSSSSIAFTYQVPQDAVGGEYKIRSYGGSYNIPDSIRIVRIREYE